MATPPPRSRPARFPVYRGLIVGLLVVASADRAGAQSQVKKVFEEPVLVYGSQGHTAPVRALAFTPDGTQLLSAGMDKVVNRWAPDLANDRCPLLGKIRPPIWRAHRGHIYALALSPVADDRGRRLLAVAGAGLSAHGGDLLLFRLDRNDDSTGAIVAKLPRTQLDADSHDGHTKSVTSLAFSPDGRRLASASNDRTVRVWDVERAQNLPPGGSARVAVLDHGGIVSGVAFLPDGTLVTGDRQGMLRRWDLKRPDRPVAVQSLCWREFPAGDPRTGVECLAVSPDGRSVVAAQSCGWITRYDGALAKPAALLRLPVERARPVLSLAFSPDGKSIAWGIVRADWADPSKIPMTDSAVEVHDARTGALRSGPYPATGLVQACAFDPNPEHPPLLAFAGGDRNDLHLVDLSRPEKPALVRRGEGSAIWDLGFTDDSRAVGFTWQRPDRDGVPETYQRFDLIEPHFDAVPPASLRKAVASSGNVAIVPRDAHRIDVRVGANSFALTLDPITERRWWSYSIIPPRPEAARRATLVAVGCELGVALFRIDGAGVTKVRFFAGHNGPVLALAPSPDGRWLATASSDQTIRLWSLAGCDRTTPIGAELDRDPATRRLVVRSVAPRSIAEDIDLRAGDRIARVYYDGKEVTPDWFVAALAQSRLAPNTQVLFEGEHRGGAQPEAFKTATTLRDSPLVTLFPTVDREWVVWMPQGYYETSGKGDFEHIGWHRNQGGAHEWKASLYARMKAFEKDLRRPNALKLLLNTSDVDRALLVARNDDSAPAPPPVREVARPRQAEPTKIEIAKTKPAAPPKAEIAKTKPPEPPKTEVAKAKPAEPKAEIARGKPADRPATEVVVQSWPPTVRIVDPIHLLGYPLPYPREDLPLTARITPEGTGGVDSIEVFRNTRPVAGYPKPLDRLKKEFQEAIRVALVPGWNRVAVKATNEYGKAGAGMMDVYYLKDVNRPPQMVVLTVGDSFARDRALKIQFADADAEDVLTFFQEKAKFEARQGPGARSLSRSIIGGKADEILGGFRDLDRWLQDRAILPGDTVLVYLETHFLDFGAGKAAFLGDDWNRDDPATPTIPAAEVADVLERLNKADCTVVLFLDPIHKTTPKRPHRALTEWVRELWLKRNVITFVASKDGPSLRDADDGHGIFTRAIRSSFDERTHRRPPVRTDIPFTLEDFRHVVIDSVYEYSGRNQFADCYIPEGFPPQLSIFEPKAAPAPAFAQQAGN